MASAELKTILELVGSADLGSLTLRERRELMGSGARRRPGARRSSRSTRMACRPSGWSRPGVSSRAGGAVLPRRRLPPGLARRGSAACSRCMSAAAQVARAQRRLPPGARASVPRSRRGRADRLPLAHRQAARPTRQVVAIGGDSSGGGLALAAPRWRCVTPASPLPARGRRRSRRGPTWTLGGESLQSACAAVDVMLTPDGVRGSAADWYLAGAGSPASRMPRRSTPTCTACRRS